MIYFIIPSFFILTYIAPSIPLLVFPSALQRINDATHASLFVFDGHSWCTCTSL